MKTEPTEALKILDETRLNPIHEIPRHKAELAAKIAFQEGQSNPKIKQLEWKETNYYIEAQTKIGKYLTQLSGTSINSESRVQMYFCGTGEIVFNGTLGEAKEAAQADFEKRIKEYLE